MPSSSGPLPAHGAKLAAVDLTARREGRLAEVLFRGLCAVAVYAPLIVLVWLLSDVVRTGIGRIDWDFITAAPSRMAGRAGIYPALMGSLWLITLTALIALPLGVGAAVYLEEYGKGSRLAGWIEINIANLAGVPSIIYGLLGLELFVHQAGIVLENTFLQRKLQSLQEKG